MHESAYGQAHKHFHVVLPLHQVDPARWKQRLRRFVSSYTPHSETSKMVQLFTLRDSLPIRRGTEYDAKILLDTVIR